MGDNLNRVRGLKFRIDVAERLQKRTGRPVMARGAEEASFPSAGSLTGLPGWTLISAADSDRRDWGSHLDRVGLAAAADRSQLSSAILHRPGYDIGGAVVLMTLDTYARWVGDPR